MNSWLYSYHVESIKYIFSAMVLNMYLVADKLGLEVTHTYVYTYIHANLVHYDSTHNYFSTVIFLIYTLTILKQKNVN